MAPKLSPGSNPGVARFAMSTNFAAFNAKFQAFLKTYTSHVADVVLAHALDFQQSAQLKAPVRTRRFANSIHTAKPGEVDSFIYADDQGNQFDGSLTDIPIGPATATVGTNVPYAIFLEAGHSRQAPAGVFAITLKEKEGALGARLAEQLGEDWQRNV